MYNFNEEIPTLNEEELYEVVIEGNIKDWRSMTNRRRDFVREVISSRQKSLDRLKRKLRTLEKNKNFRKIMGKYLGKKKRYIKKMKTLISALNKYPDSYPPLDRMMSHIFVVDFGMGDLYYGLSIGNSLITGVQEPEVIKREINDNIEKVLNIGNAGKDAKGRARTGFAYLELVQPLWKEYEKTGEYGVFFAAHFDLFKKLFVEKIDEIKEYVEREVMIYGGICYPDMIRELLKDELSEFPQMRKSLRGGENIRPPREYSLHT